MPIGIYKRKPITEEHRKNLSKAKLKSPTRYWLGKKQSPEQVRKRVEARKGYKPSEETKQRMRLAAIEQVRNGTRIFPNNSGKKRPDITGSKHPRWRGDYPEQYRLRNSVEMENWRKAVFERDDYRCLSCGERGGKLNADHIWPFSQFLRLRFDINNGRTLCVDCHRQTETYGYPRFSIEGRSAIYLTQ